MWQIETHYLLSTHCVAGQVREPMTPERIQESMRNAGAVEAQLRVSGAFVSAGVCTTPAPPPWCGWPTARFVTADAPFVETRSETGMPQPRGAGPPCATPRRQPSPREPRRPRADHPHRHLQPAAGELHRQRELTEYRQHHGMAAVAPSSSRPSDEVRCGVVRASATHLRRRRRRRHRRIPNGFLIGPSSRVGTYSNSWIPPS